MQVMCIDDTRWAKDVPCPSFGEVVTVSDIDNKRHGPAYEFIEYGEGHWYSQKYFAPVSDIDETERVSEEFNEKYLVPVK